MRWAEIDSLKRILVSHGAPIEDDPRPDCAIWQLHSPEKNTKGEDMRHALTVGSITLSIAIAGCASVDDGPTATAKLEPKAALTSPAWSRSSVGERVRITGEVNGHAAGVKGWHIHEKGDCSDPKGMSAGGRFNPLGHKHGAPTDPARHAGDTGNLLFNDRGSATISMTVTGISVSQGRAVGRHHRNRAVIIHMDTDDLKNRSNRQYRWACGFAGVIS